jgi:hypothetical protein
MIAAAEVVRGDAILAAILIEVHGDLDQNDIKRRLFVRCPER